MQRADLGLLLRLALPGTAAFLTVDLLILRALLRPIRTLFATDASPAESERGMSRLLAWPTLVLPRIFGPHAVSATFVVSLLVLWVNRVRGPVIPESDFPLYWFLNLTVVPVAHAVYEYHASERLFRSRWAAWRSEPVFAWTRAVSCSFRWLRACFFASVAAPVC